MASDQDDLLDIKQAAQFLNVSETSLRRWTNSGRLACLRVGRKRERRFRRTDLVAFLEDQPAGAPAVSHMCGFYASDVSRATLAAHFLTRGFTPGSVSYVAATRPTLDQIALELERRRPALRSDVAAGRLVLVEHPELEGAHAYRDNWGKLFSSAQQRGALALRAVGDVSGGPGLRLGRDELLEFEQLYDELAQRFRVPTLCLYDVRHVSGLDVLDVLQYHHEVFPHPLERLIR